MAKAKPSTQNQQDPEEEEESMELLLEEQAFKRGMEAIIQVHLQTLKQSYNHIQKLIQTTLIPSYLRLERIHEVKNDRFVFENSSESLQKHIKSTIKVAENITTILKSILPRHTLDYVSDNNTFFLANFSPSENLKVSKFQKKTEFVRNKIVEVTVKLYNLRRKRIKKSIIESVQYERFRKQGGTLNLDGRADFIHLKKQYRFEKDWEDYIERKIWRRTEGRITEERDEIMMKIEKGMRDLEGILFEIYVMVQTQVAINVYAISEKWNGGTGYHDNIQSLAKETNTTPLSIWWFKSKIISFTDDIYYYYCVQLPTLIDRWINYRDGILYSRVEVREKHDTCPIHSSH